MLLFDRDRLSRLLCDETRPVQLVLAGKAHPDDEVGKQIIRQWIRFVYDMRFRRRVVDTAAEHGRPASVAYGERFKAVREL